MGLGKIAIKALTLSGEIVKWGVGYLVQESGKYNEAKDNLNKHANYCQDNEDGLGNWDNERLMQEYKKANHYERSVIMQELKNRQDNK